MEKYQARRDSEAWQPLWSLSRLEIRSPVTNAARPLARLELFHPARGRVSDIASAPSACEAAFAAAAHIVGVSPRLLGLKVDSPCPSADGRILLLVEIELEVDGLCYRGSSRGTDLLECAIAAWLHAACASLARIGAVQHRPRPYRVSGVDENGDLWTFASDDEGAALAIAAEFRNDHFVEVAHSTPPSPTNIAIPD